MAITLERYSSTVITSSSHTCPLIWNSGGYALYQYYDANLNRCNPSANRMYIPTCTTIGPIPSSATNPTASFQDGMTLGWGVAAAMIVVYVIRRVHR